MLSARKTALVTYCRAVFYYYLWAVAFMVIAMSLSVTFGQRIVVGKWWLYLLVIPLEIALVVAIPVLLKAIRQKR